MRMVVVSLIVIITLYAEQPLAESQFSAAEIAMLPKYCQDKLAKRNKEKWGAIFGRSWGDMHHMCFGIAFYNRSRKIFGSSPKENQRKNHNLHNAANNFSYVINAADTNFVLLPELYVRRGMALEHNQPGEAINDFRQAMNLNSSYIPAYIAMSNLYRKLGSIDSARDILENALRYMPDSKRIKRHLARLESESNSQ